MDASVYGRGAGEGFGVHILTGPIYVCGAEPGDIIEVQILDVYARPSANPEHAGKAFGSNAAAWWGYHYNDLIEEPKPREVITIYEMESTADASWAKPLYNFRWVPQTDPYGVVHETIDYPGVPVDHDTIEERHGIMPGVRVPIRPHFGVIGLAPDEADIVDSIPPSYFGGNIDNWRIGKGATMYYPVAVEGGLLSLGDSHAAQGDSELAGTAIEMSLTGQIEITVHKAHALEGTVMEDSALSAARDRRGVGRTRVQLRELPRRARRERAAGHLLEVERRRGAARCVSQDAALPHDHPGAQRGRGNLADVGRGPTSRDAGGRRQLGRARDDRQSGVRRRSRLTTTGMRGCLVRPTAVSELTGHGIGGRKERKTRRDPPSVGPGRARSASARWIRIGTVRSLFGRRHPPERLDELANPLRESTEGREIEQIVTRLLRAQAS